MPQLLLTAMGPDKPGLVGELTGHLHAGGANIVDSRMVNLRGQFAIILLIEAAEAPLAKLRHDLPTLARHMGLNVLLADHAPAVAAQVTGLPFKLKTYSLDQPGLVHKITDVLRAHGVNIEELQARQESAAFAGSTLFVMEMRLTVPGTVAVRKLRAELEKQAETLNCDLDLEPA
ncbi:MAG: ACT domain-containing protein [Phycisphaerae bacterium]